MKKLVLTSAALMCLAAATYAQTNNQVGQQQFASQNQFGQNQVGTINQIQSATDPSRQNYGNYAITYQGTPVNTGANTLLINQNDGSQGNRAGIGQTGGPDNSATISQSGGNLGLSGGATSTSATAGSRGEDGNFAGIAQTGSANTAVITEDNNSRRNSAETYQNGTTNSSTTNQSNNSVSNTGYIFQGYSGMNAIGTAVNNAVAQINQGKGAEGDVSAGQAVPEAVGSTAVITQTASNVAAQINQGGFFGGGGAGRADGVNARITQSAVNTQASISQGVLGGEAIGSRAVITQSATNQIADIEQGYGVQNGTSGSDNQSTATITQNGSSGGVINAFIGQGTSGGASDRATATINQTSSVTDASATIYQGYNPGSYSSGDKATITQSGKNLEAYIGQGDVNTPFTPGSETNGRDNTATIDQQTGVTNGVVEIYQGSARFGEVIQANRNTATVTQVAGTGHLARIGQGDLSLQDANRNTFVVTGLNGVDVLLTGTIANDNTATITQMAGDGHNANIFQTGRFNQASVTQNGGSGAQALIIQTSNSQRASAQISQTATGTGNVATILQFAGSNADNVGQFGNIAGISQTLGSNNIAFIQQGDQGPGVVSSSNDNTAYIKQNGSNNTTRFLQTGNNNYADITQNGVGNTVTGIAPGSTFASQQGYNNRLTLVQNGGNGPGLTFRYTQIGNNNTQVVNQNY